MERFETRPEKISGHEWHSVHRRSSRDGKFYWTLFKDGREHKLEIDSVPQRTPKAAVSMAHFFNEGLNATGGQSGK